MKILTTIASILLASTIIAQNFSHQVIDQRLSLENSKIPTYIKFAPDDRPSINELDVLFEPFYKRETNFSFNEIGRDVDQLGFTIIRYEQSYMGKAIELAEIVVHVKNGQIYSISGKLIDTPPFQTTSNLTESEALRAAMNYIGATSYKWQIAEEENHLKVEQNNPAATYFPTGELKYIASSVSLNPAELKLAYKFNIYAHDPLGRQEVYVDAANGQIVFTNNLIHTINTQGTATTAYSGTQTINTDSLSATSFRLRQTVMGGGVYTFNMQNGTNYFSAVDFTDTDNNWNNVNTNLDQYATDAHWGAERTYDYFFTKFARNSINNAGFALNSYVHYSTSFANAFWDGQRMTYGDGSGGITPLVALDIAGHEIAHGLTTFSANLVYASESGALNESFSDIFGAAIEFYARPTNANWNIGEDIGSTLRSMSNPSANPYNDPDTYDGSFWVPVVGCTPTRFNDQCGVHTNSGVQNFWFYLLTQGGTGVNDNGAAYSVTGIGIDKAGAIAYRNLTTYLTQSSDYSDARYYSLRAAADLYGNCSPEMQSVTNAWHAVGVGAAYTPGVTSDFTSDFTTSCTVPFTVSFQNTSSNDSIQFWDFGDGTTSTLRNPVHTYTAYGQYDVQLIADGGSCGIDTLTKMSFIDVDTANPCVIILQNGTNVTQTDCSGKIFDDGGATGDYSPNQNSVITISPAGAASVTLNFISFDVEPGSGTSCNFDNLEVFDGTSVNAPSLGVFCNNNIPTTITSTTSSVTIQFFSDGLVEEAGFEIDWSCNSATASPTANFNISTSSSCDGEISFTDLSTQAPSTWLWDFGDGNTSSMPSPTHTYTVNDTFDVQLVVTNGFGSDTLTQTAAVIIDRPAAPTVTHDTACIGQAATLSASATGALTWYDAEFGGSAVGTGNNITLNNLMADTTLWVESLVAAPIQTVGPTSNTIGTGANFSFDQHLIFSVFEKIELVSVRVYAGSSGTRTIELRDNNGIVLQSLTRNIPAGPFRVNLNFVIDPGTDYQLGVTAGSQPNLYRNNSGTAYPYTIANKISITGSSASNPTGFYYFFYNWRVKSLDCLSPREAAIAKLDTSCNVTSIGEVDIEKGVSIYPNPATSQLNIDLSNVNDDVQTIRVKDLTGKLVAEKTVSTTEQIMRLDVGNWSDGIYILQFETRDSFYAKKVVVNHK